MPISAECPACRKNIRVDEDAKVQELILCPYCKTLLEFVKAIPPTFERFLTYSENLPSKCVMYKTVVRSINL